jgi:hypothetical protein
MHTLKEHHNSLKISQGEYKSFLISEYEAPAGGMDCDEVPIGRAYVMRPRGLID